MYCRYCGKKTENTDGVCNDCRNGADGIVGGAAYDKSYGYKDALFACVYGSITVFFAVIGYFMACVYVTTIPGLVISVLFGFGSLPAVIVGAKSIKRFIEAKRNGVKPVATLVLGIVGVATSGFALLFALLSVVVSITILYAFSMYNI